jgi:titin
VGVAGYYLMRNGSVIATTASLYYQDSGLTSSTTYTYNIEAFDLGANISTPSTPISVTTKDVTPPTTPGGVAATATSCQKVMVTWSPSTDNTAIGSYIVFWGLSPAALVQVGRASATGTVYPSSSLTAGTANYYGVEAVDTSGNVSAMSAIVSATTPMPPAPPASVVATAASTTRIGLTWSASVGGGLPIQNYHVYRGTTASSLSQVAVALGTVYSDTAVTEGTTYYYAVEAADTGADLSPMSAIASATPLMPPAAPTSLVATAASMTRIGLTWSASVSGGLPIQNYHVYRGTTASSLSQVAVTLGTVYSDSTVTEGTTYYYAVQAADSGADLSPMSATVSATPLLPPAAPTGLVATAASTTRIGLTWSASVSGGLPIQNYHVYRGTTASSLSQLAVTLGTVYNDSAVTEGTTYYYAVQAADSSADLSPMSATVSATPLPMPSPPTALNATSPTKTEVSLTWSAGPSGMPLSSYSVFRGSSPSNLTSLRVVAATQASTNDYTVVAGATYYYAVQEKDTGGNLSPMSETVSVTTP